MWNPEFKTPFIDEYCAKHGVEVFLGRFFDFDLNPLPDAPHELRLEIARIRGERSTEEPTHAVPAGDPDAGVQSARSAAHRTPDDGSPLSPYHLGVTEGMTIRVRYVGIRYRSHLGGRRTHFAAAEDGLYRIYDEVNGEDFGHSPEDFELLECYDTPKGGVEVKLDERQRALLASLRLPTALSTGMGEDAWVEIADLLKEEVQVQGINDTTYDQNDYGLLCTSVYDAMLDAEEAQDVLDAERRE